MDMVRAENLEEIDAYIKNYSYSDNSNRENLAVLRSTYSIRNKISSWYILANAIYTMMKLRNEENLKGWFVGLFTEHEFNELDKE